VIAEYSKRCDRDQKLIEASPYGWSRKKGRKTVVVVWWHHCI